MDHDEVTGIISEVIKDLELYQYNDLALIKELCDYVRRYCEFEGETLDSLKDRSESFSDGWLRNAIMSSNLMKTLYGTQDREA